MSQVELMDRLGGPAAIAELVDDMYRRISADEELSPFFEGVDMQRLRNMQYEFIASALGGPVAYSGQELQSIHAGRGITAKHFSKFVGHLASAMEDRNVAADDVHEMLGKIAMYRDKVIGSANVDG